MKLIPLTQGKFAKVDDEDYEWLMQWKWQAHKVRSEKWYAERMEGRGKFRKHIYMHREISKSAFGQETDHRDGDGLNNQRLNLRPCTKSQNMANRTKTILNSSGYKGVCKNGNGWAARINKDKVSFNLGTYPTKEEAAYAYDEKAKEIFGEFATTNF